MTRKSKHETGSVTSGKIAASASASRVQQGSESHPTIELILSSARQVLIEHGHVGFTTRLVAESAAISPGSLSYHFPSKTELLQAVISRLVEDYARQFEIFLSDFKVSAGQEL